MNGEHDTSIHLRKVAKGDLESVAWIVGRFTPLLRIQAETRLTPALRRVYDPIDLVNDVWLRALPRLRGVKEVQGSVSRGVLELVSELMITRIFELVKRRIAGLAPEDLGGPGVLADDEGTFRDDASGVVTRAARAEATELVHGAIAELSASDREIVVLCGIEQRRRKEVAVMLGISEDAVFQRYHRAVERLQKRLPDSVLADLAPDAG